MAFICLPHLISTQSLNNLVKESYPHAYQWYLDMSEKYPDAKLIAHPECQEKILAEADFIGSTTALLKFVEDDDATEFIVATEVGIIHKMKQAVPHKKLIPAPANTNNTCACSECPYMKLNTLEKIHASLVHLQPEIFVPEETRLKALKSVNRMLKLS